MELNKWGKRGMERSGWELGGSVGSSMEREGEEMRRNKVRRGEGR